MNQPNPSTPRINEGYAILDSVTIGTDEFVLGVHRSTQQDMFVTWKCSGGSNYYWGHYFTDELSAKRDLLQRAKDELERLDKQQLFRAESSHEAR
jgi:hypothetical protein